MKIQWNLLLGLLFAVVIAVFAVVNVESVPINYIFGQAEWPLVLIILFSSLFGAMFSTFIALFKGVQTNRKIKELMKEINGKELTIAAQQNEIMDLQKANLHVEKEDELKNHTPD